MDTPAEFAATYQHMSDGQLLQTANEGGLIPEAHQALTEELHRRNLKPADLRRYKPSPHELLQDEARQKGWRGTGLFFFGRSYLNQSDEQKNVQLRTKFVSFAYFPLVPIAAYRFQCTGSPKWWLRWNNGQQVIDRVPLNWRQVTLTWVKAVLITAALMGSAIFFAIYQDRGR